MAQCGDPTGTGKGGTSVYGLCYGEQAKYFEDECHQLSKHDRKGLVCMANAGAPNTNGSQFFLCTVQTAWLDGNHVVFGSVTKGLDVVKAVEGVGTSSGKTTKQVMIADCGQLS